jgi:acyl transferase domain-containing protein
VLSPETLAAQFVRGQATDPAAWGKPGQRRKVTLPTYPFQRQRYWIEPTSPSVLAARPAVAGESLRANLTLLGPDGTVLTEVRGLAVKRVLLANGTGSGGHFQVEWTAQPSQPQAWPMSVNGNAAAGPAVAGIAARLRLAPPERRVRLLVDHLQAEVQQVLGLPDAPDPRRGFMELGMDSLLAVALCNRLQEQLDRSCTVSATALFDHPNVAALAAHLARQLDPAESTMPEITPEPDAEGSAADREELSRLSETERLDLLRSELADLLERV